MNHGGRVPLISNHGVLSNVDQFIRNGSNYGSDHQASVLHHLPLALQSRSRRGYRRNQTEPSGLYASLVYYPTHSQPRELVVSKNRECLLA